MDNVSTLIDKNMNNSEYLNYYCKRSAKLDESTGEDNINLKYTNYEVTHTPDPEYHQIVPQINLV